MSKPAPTLTVKVMCDDCLKDVEFDYDGVECPECHSFWPDALTHDGEVAYSWFDDDGEEHHYD